MKQVFIIDDEKDIRNSVRQWLELSGFQVRDFSRACMALENLSPDFPGVVISDVKMPGMNGLEFLKAVADIDSDIPVILLTAHGDITMAVQAIRDGAYDFVEKPFDPGRIVDIIQRGLEKRFLVLENRLLKRKLIDSAGIDARLVGSSKAILALKKEIMDVAPSTANVLLVGETGTGKELVARCIHDLSDRRSGPFVAVNCAAIPTNLAESELFGHERGAFTGAERQRVGTLEAAKGGTLFLDEVTSMPIEIQGKLLRTIQDKEILPIGSNTTHTVDFRLISATNENPPKAIQEGRLREDLYYRISTLEIRIDPLQERKEDIPLLFSLFLERAAETFGREIVPPEPKVYMALMGHRWPGNVRELKNMAERYVLYSSNPGEKLLKALTHQDESELQPDAPLSELIHYFERQVIKDAIKRHAGNIKAVMNELGLPRRTLNEKMVKYGLNKADGCPP